MQLHRIILVTALLFGCIASSHAREIIKNGDFSKSKIDPWKLVITRAYGSTAEAIVEDGVLRVEISQSSKINYLALHQQIKIRPDKTYRLSFETKTDSAEKEMRVSVTWRKDSDWGRAGLMKKFESTDQWSKFEYTFTALKGESGSDYKLGLALGSLDDDAYFRNVSLTEI